MESYLSRTRDVTSTEAPRRTTIDHAGCFQAESLRAATHGHAERVQFPRGESGEDPQFEYLNNIVEQDHRRIKSRVQPMLGFKKFYNARRVLIGVELLQKLGKGQYLVPRSFGRSLDAIWGNVLAA